MTRMTQCKPASSGIWALIASIFLNTVKAEGKTFDDLSNMSWVELSVTHLCLFKAELQGMSPDSFLNK